jgi:hypothetical protein
MLVVVLLVDVSVGAVVYVGLGFVVVPAVEDGQVLPPAAYPKSARKRMKMMNPNAVSVESSAMLCLDQIPCKTLVNHCFSDQTSFKTIVVHALRRSKRRAKHFDHGSQA